MESNFEFTLNSLESQLEKAFNDNYEKSIINIYGYLSVFEYKTMTNEDSEIRKYAYKAQSVKNRIIDFLTE